MDAAGAGAAGLLPGVQAELLARFALAALLGGVLGWDRQLGQHPAGLRVHILVALGAAVFSIAGTHGLAGQGTVQDAGRIAAQVVVGVGFLGAGTIWRSRDDRVIYGLTTAASIWLAAGLGMLSAFGMYFLAVGGAVIGFGVLRVLKPLEAARLSLPRPILTRLRPIRAVHLPGAPQPLPEADAVPDGLEAVTPAEEPPGEAAETEVPPRRTKPKKGRKVKRGASGPAPAAQQPAA